MVEKFCISLPEETIGILKYLQQDMRLNPTIKRSQLINQIIFECYSNRLAQKNNKEQSTAHMTKYCYDDCMTYKDAQDCIYSQHPTKYK